VKFLEVLAGNRSPAEGAEHALAVFALWGGALLDQLHGCSQQFGVFENESAEWRRWLLHRCVFPTTDGGWRNLEGGPHSNGANGSGNVLVVNDNESLAKLFKDVPGLWFLHCPLSKPMVEAMVAPKIEAFLEFCDVPRLSHLVQESVGGTQSTPASEDWWATPALSGRSCVRGLVRVCVVAAQRWLFFNRREDYEILERVKIATILGELTVVSHPTLQVTYRLEHIAEGSMDDGEDKNAHSDDDLLHSCSVEKCSFYESKTNTLHLRLDTLQAGRNFARGLTEEFVRILDESLQLNGVSSLQILQVSSGRELENLLSVLVMQSATCGGDEATVDEMVADVLESRQIHPLPPNIPSWLIVGETLAARNNDTMRATEAGNKSERGGGDCGDDEETAKPSELDYSGKMASFEVGLSRKKPATTPVIGTPVWPPEAPTVEMRDAEQAPVGFGGASTTTVRSILEDFGDGSGGSRNDVGLSPEVSMIAGGGDSSSSNSNADVESLKVRHDLLPLRNMASGTATIAQFLERFEQAQPHLHQVQEQFAATSGAATFAAASSSSSFGAHHWPAVDTAKLAHECFVVDVELQDRDTTFDALDSGVEGLSKAASSKNGSGERAAAVLGEYLVFSALQKG
jgi:hypothetical protein